MTQSLPIDSELYPISKRLLATAIARYEAGENPVLLRLSPERSRYAGRLYVLMSELLGGADGRMTGSVRCWTGENRCAVLEVLFSNATGKHLL